MSILHFSKPILCITWWSSSGKTVPFRCGIHLVIVRSDSEGGGGQSKGVKRREYNNNNKYCAREHVRRAAQPRLVAQCGYACIGAVWSWPGEGARPLFFLYLFFSIFYAIIVVCVCALLYARWRTRSSRARYSIHVYNIFLRRVLQIPRMRFGRAEKYNNITYYIYIYVCVCVCMWYTEGG
uniref:Uncharacterized protein n=1 Tax=Schizaphis graminum TaxID=13262 RepID=A0A2S2NMN0_SCHGA